MKNWRPASWSKQARELANTQYEAWEEIQKHPEKEQMYYAHDGRVDENFNHIMLSNATIAYYVDFFSCSYRHSVVRQRAAKRFGRLTRKYLDKCTKI